VIIGDSNGCVNSANKYVLITGIDDVLNEGDILIYPNPSNGAFMVELQNGINHNELTIEIVNALGQILFSATKQTASKEIWKKEIDLCSGDARSCVSTGIYFIGIKTINSFARKKIVIE
jgi:hypothetical protein